MKFTPDFLNYFEREGGTERESDNPGQALCCQCRGRAQSHEPGDGDLCLSYPDAPTPDLLLVTAVCRVSTKQGTNMN